MYGLNLNLVKVVTDKQNISHLHKHNNNEILILRRKNHGVLESDVILFLYNLHHLRDYSYSAQNVSHFTEIMTILKDHYFTVESIMEEVMFKLRFK